jgi:HEAT repeat protein
MVAGSMGDTRALARVGDEGAVRRLIDQIENSPGGKMFQIDALVQSRSPLAIPPLTKLLDDRNHPDHIAAAANGLGTLNARAAIPQLRRLYADTSLPSPVRFMAAAGLYKMNDMTGLPLLQMQLTSENANLRIGAARFMAGQPGGGQPDATWLTVVRGLVGDPDPAVRVQAAELVAAYDLDLARQSLEGLLTDENAAIRGLAGLAYIDRVATDFGTLRRFLRSPDGLTQVRAAGRVLELTR